MQVPLPGTEPRLNSPRATECQVTVFPGKIHLANLRRLFIGESKGKRVHGLWRRIDSVMDDAADDSFEEISFFSFIFVLEVYIYRERYFFNKNLEKISKRAILLLFTLE